MPLYASENELSAIVAVGGGKDWFEIKYQQKLINLSQFSFSLFFGEDFSRPCVKYFCCKLLLSLWNLLCLIVDFSDAVVNA